MVYSARLPRSKRAALLASIAATHVALLILLMTIREAPRAIARPAASISVAMLPAEKTRPKPLRRPIVIKPTVPSQAPVVSISLPVAPAFPAITAGKDCAVLDQLQKSIVADPDAQAAIDQLPVEARSLSDATVIWNADWSEVANAPDAPLAAVRNDITQTLATIDSHCLSDPVVGPRMIAVPSGAQTRLLVIGSGIWSWGQLGNQGSTVNDAQTDSERFTAGSTDYGADNEIIEIAR